MLEVRCLIDPNMNCPRECEMHARARSFGEYVSGLEVIKRPALNILTDFSRFMYVGVLKIRGKTGECENNKKN